MSHACHRSECASGPICVEHRASVPTIVSISACGRSLDLQPEQAQPAFVSEFFAEMSYLIEQFTQPEKDSIRQVHKAIQNNAQHGRLALIRNETIFNSDKLFGFVEAFGTILEVNNIDCDNPAWRRLKEISKSHKAENTSADGQDAKAQEKLRTRIKQTMYVSMQWSLEVMAHYQWDAEKFARDRLLYVYNCARIFPKFKLDFIPQANLVRYLKHCAALSTSKKSTEDDFAPYGGEFAVKDLHLIQKLKGDKPTMVYGREVTRQTASELEHEIRRWTENQTGVVIVGGKRLDLKKERKNHWNMLLLKFDENGLLVRRQNSDRAATPRRDGVLSPPMSMLVPVDGPVRLQARCTASAETDSTSSAASDMRGSAAGSVAGSVAGSSTNSSTDSSTDSSAHRTADRTTEVTAADTTNPAPPHIQDGPDPHDSYDTPKTSHSDADSKSAHHTGASALMDTPIAPPKIEPSEPGEPDSAYENSPVRRTARARRKTVAQMFLEDDEDGSEDQGSNGQESGDKPSDNNDGSDDQESNDQGPGDELPGDEISHDKDSDDERSNDGHSGDLLQVHVTVERTPRTPTSTDGLGQELGEEQESTWEPTRERDNRIPDNHSDSNQKEGCETTMEEEAAADHGDGTGASANTFRGQASEPHVSVRDVVAADFDGIESWLIGQGQDRSLFVGDSPSVADCRKSEAPETTPTAQTRTAQKNDEASKAEALPRESERAALDVRDASVYPGTSLFLPPVTHKPPRASPVLAVLPQSLATQSVRTKPSVATETDSSDSTSPSTASESSSELTSERRTDNSDSARTVQGLRSSSERSSNGNDPTPFQASLDGSDDGEVWPGCNARDLTSPLNFAGLGNRTREKLFNASDALAAMRPEKTDEYMYQMPPSILAPFLPHMSVEESEEEVWNGGYKMPYGGPRWHSDEDLGSSHRSCGTSQDPPELPYRHFGPRPESCACDTCDDILPLLERVRVEASSNNASRSCRVRDRWFGNAKWASAVGASGLGEPGRRSDHEVMYLDSASFRDMAGERSLLEKPIVVRELQHDRGLYNVEVVREAMRDSYRNRSVTLADALTDAPTLVGMEEFLTRFSSNEWSVGTSTLCDSLGAQRPAFLSHNRFRLLHKAVTRAMCHSVEWGGGGGAGCSDVAHSLCVSGGLSFNRIESSGACSGPRLDPLGGTWIRNLEGRRLCAFVPREQLTTSLLDGSVRDGLEWWPHDKQRLVLLEPDDVLILPPNVVCAQLAVDAGVSFQGSFWDEQEWGRYFTAAQWAVKNPTHVTPQIPRCATRLALFGLESIARDDPQRFASDPIALGFLGTDRTGMLKAVMAERCSTSEPAANGSMKSPNALATPGGRRMSKSEADVELPAKRMCIR